MPSQLQKQTKLVIHFVVNFIQVTCYNIIGCVSAVDLQSGGFEQTSKSKSFWLG